MSRWPTEKHFTSWLTLAPHNNISGGRLLSSKTQPSANRAAGILRMAAMSLGRTETALGAFYRRLAYRVGKAKAITATARKLAILVYRTLKDGLVYQDPGPPRTTPNTARASFAACASVPPISASHSSITKLARCSRVQFLRRRRHHDLRRGSPTLRGRLHRHQRIRVASARPSSALKSHRHTCRTWSDHGVVSTLTIVSATDCIRETDRRCSHASPRGHRVERRTALPVAPMSTASMLGYCPTPGTPRIATSSFTLSHEGERSWPLAASPPVGDTQPSAGLTRRQFLPLLGAAAMATSAPRSAAGAQSAADSRYVYVGMRTRARRPSGRNPSQHGRRHLRVQDEPAGRQADARAGRSRGQPIVPGAGSDADAPVLRQRDDRRSRQRVLDRAGDGEAHLPQQRRGERRGHDPRQRGTRPRRSSSRQTTRAATSPSSASSPTAPSAR